jgi:hypothetical protein
MDENQIATEIDGLHQKYGITIVRSGPQFPVEIPPHGKIHGKAAGRENIESYWPLFGAEWNLYPTELVEKTKLQRIILCEGLAFENSQGEQQLRTALPDLGYTSEYRHLYLDVARGRHSELYVREVIHHEYFHIIHWCTAPNLDDKDEEWTALNHATFTYGTGGEDQQGNPDASVIIEDVPGFLTPYAMSGLKEDKAEIFAYMVVARQYMEERATKDEIIKKKMQKMKERLQAFCPELNVRFWNQAGAVERPKVQPRSVKRPMV